jgi:hypothetical protein
MMTALISGITERIETDEHRPFGRLNKVNLSSLYESVDKARTFPRGRCRFVCSHQTHDFAA